MTTIVNQRASLLALPCPALLVLLLLLGVVPSLTLASSDTSIHVLSLPTFGRKVPPRSVRAAGSSGSPVESSSCGYARVTHVGVSVNKGAHAVLHYKLRVNAVPAHELAYADYQFMDALSETRKQQYLSFRNGYSGGLDIPFLRFLGVDLDDRFGKGKKGHSLDDAEYIKLSGIAEGIMTKATKQVVVVKGKLTATGTTCMKTTAYAFIKVARVKMRGGHKLTVLTTKGEDVIAATKHADTVLPNKGGFKVIDFSRVE